MKIVILIKMGSSRYGLCCKGIYAKEQADSQYLFFRDSNMSLVRNQLLTFLFGILKYKSQVQAVFLTYK